MTALVSRGRVTAAIVIVMVLAAATLVPATPTAAFTVEPDHDAMATWQTDGNLVNGKNLTGRVWHIEYGHGATDGMVFVGGRFQSLNAPAGGEGGTVARTFVAAIDVDTGYLVERFNPQIVGEGGSPEIRALELSGDGRTLYIGGWFTSVNGEARRHLAAVDAITGALDPWNPNPSAKVSVLKATADGATLYAGGLFVSMSGAARTYVAAFDMTDGGSLVDDFAPVIEQPGPIRCGPRCWPVVLGMALSPNEGTLYVGGAFGIVDGQERHSAAAFDTADGSLRAWNPDIYHTRLDGTGSLNTVYELDATADRVYVCGDYWAINSGGNQYASPNVQAVDAVSGIADRNWVASTDGAVNDCAIVDDTLVVGGHFEYAGGVKPNDGDGEVRQHIAGFDLVTGDLVPWNPRANSAAGLYALGRHATDYLGVGGDFTTINGDPQEGFAQFPIGVLGPWPPLLEEDFSNGLGNWFKVKNFTTDPSVGADDTPSVAASVAADRGYAWFEMPIPRRAVCVSVEIRPDALDEGVATLVMFRDATNRPIAEMYRQSNGKLKLRSAVSGQKRSTTAVLETGVWHTVETCITKGANSQWEVAVDGVQVATWSPDVGNKKIGIIQIGDSSKRTWDGHFDDVVVRIR